MKHVTNIFGETCAEDLSRFTFEPVKRVRLVRREPAGGLTIVLKRRNVGQRQGKVSWWVHKRVEVWNLAAF